MDALKRLLEGKPRARAGEHCDFCGTDLGHEHSHAVSVEQRRLLCTCRACYLLFTHEGAAQGKYKAVPEDYRRGGQAFDEARWDGLQIPVNMAFFFFNSSLKRVVAFYPSPAGATESLLSLEAWNEVLRGDPTLETLVPDVEALLVQRRSGAFESFRVPIDACYELVGRVKRYWKGFDGGEEAWREIDAFFASVRERADASAPRQATAP